MNTTNTNTNMTSTAAAKRPDVAHVAHATRIRATAPGRREVVADISTQPTHDFTATIRAAAPGRQAR